MSSISSQFPNVRCEICVATPTPNSLQFEIQRRVKDTPSVVLLSEDVVELITSRKSGFAETEFAVLTGVPPLEGGLLAFVSASLEKLMNPVKAGVSLPYSLPSKYITRR